MNEMIDLSKIENFSRIFIAGFFGMLSLTAHAAEQQSCITDKEAAGKLGMFFLTQPQGYDASVRKAYADFLKSGMIEYNSDRPILYSINYSFTRFFKRKCHEEECDVGDIHGTREVCSHFTNEQCQLIAATKGKDLYCFLVPLFDRPPLGEAYNPFRQ